MICWRWGSDWPDAARATSELRNLLGAINAAKKTADLAIV